jgi:MFS family permease
MVGLGETFVPAFALALGMGETAAGLIAAVPVAAGGIMQIMSLRLIHLFGSEQRWVVHMSYMTYVYLLAVAFLSRIVTLSFWGSIAKQFGASTLMWAGAIWLVPLSSLWIVSGNYVWLTVVQAVSGVAWAAYELGFFLLFFETLPAQNRTRMLTYYNFANTTAMLAGSLLGAMIFLGAGGGVSGYYLLFAISSIGRLFGLGLLWRVELAPVSVKYLAFRVLGLRPATATLDVPVLPSMETEET